MPDVRHLTVGGRFKNIPTITSFVGAAAAAAGLQDSEIFHCEMAVDEACTNIIEHAYGGENVGTIQITCVVEPGMCKIVVVDEGDQFDPSSVPAPKLNAKIEEIRPGGIGLHLMRQFMDEVHFAFESGQNTLTMVKRGEVVPKAGAEGDISVAESEPGVWSVIPHGRLDSAATPALDVVLTDLFERGHDRLVVDMTDVTYISSRGLKTLVSAWRTARERGGDVLLCSMSSHVFKVFETVGFTRVFAIYPDCDAALADAGARGA